LEIRHEASPLAMVKTKRKKVRPVGICRMCLTEQLLVDSHLIPAGIIRQCNERSLKNPDPTWLSHRLVMQTGRAVTDYLLCRACDNRLNKYGEGWVVKHTARISGDFPLRNKLIGVTPGGALDGYVYYAGSNVPGLQMDKLIHFGSGFFWRAAIHKWKMFGKDIEPTALGCEEGLRLFLLGKAEFPKNATLTISIAADKKIMPGACLPLRAHTPPEDKFAAFKFYVSGIEYLLCVGETIPEGFRISSATDPPGLIVLTPDVQKLAKELFTLHLNEGKLSQGMKATLKEIHHKRSKPES
jgi:hypothetical protein